ncbi:tetratricopeptide repeat protein [Kamptonema sp. UHCC 0994]|uniref:tetratricopeptide repeat protein n=1 Tax=Kamptonema sp. UHCC 0994 TaxID=3031329 RepID=UPI0023BA13D9|nr:tetratricopeptide repeat protein [Kamptonema sp. UHCC 0994]MDF0555854.1 tetratricopeptide repeat protein [Kamptonema sp. UHCC 0994]
MSIDDEELNSEFSSEDRKLELFTDRYEFTKLFAEYLNDDPPRKKVLYFHGDGGNGKSLLLKFLRIQCCKRFSRQKWQELKAIPDDRVAEVADYIQKAKLSQDCTVIPAILHDFGMPPIKEDLPQDPFYGLLMLRRNLGVATAQYRFKFPVYDFACYWYLLNKGESKETLERLFSDDWISLLTPGIDSAIPDAIAQFISDTIVKFPVMAQAVALLKFLDKVGGKKRQIELLKKRLEVTEEQSDEICKKDIDTELINELPKWFAQDLKAAMAGKNKPERIVLFFDTHEKFWDEKRHFQGEKLFYQDEWLRRLLRGLPLELGVVVVVAGRDHPIEQLWWTDAPTFGIPQENLDPQLLWHLSPNDAKHYLQKAGIYQAALVAALIKYASVNPDEKSGELQVHPFYLGLCADVVLTEKIKGIELQAADFASIPKLEDKARELTERLLRYADREVKSAVNSLSACRAFNQELYMKLGGGCDFLASAANFEILTSFSFVWRDRQRGEKWYRIHELLHRLDYERDNSITCEAHQVLEAHYRELGNVPEAIYHANRLDWEWGVDEWVGVFNEGLENSIYDLCRSLLEVMNELVIESEFWRGSVSRAKGDYFFRLAGYQEAKQGYLEAVAAYGREIVKNDIIFNNQGLALRSLGDLQAVLSEYPDALHSYQGAIAAYTISLDYVSDNVYVLNNKGNTLRSLGKLQARLNQSSEALKSYRDAIDIYDRAFQCDPDEIYTISSKGKVLRCIGDLQHQLNQSSEALESYKDALVLYNQSLKIAPKDVYLLNNKGKVMRRLGKLEAQFNKNVQALQSYKEAIYVYTQALQLTSDFVAALKNKGKVWINLGDLQDQLNQPSEALFSYGEAILACNKALEKAPDYVIAYNNKGEALKKLGNLQQKLSLKPEAQESYQEALAAFNRSLAIAPNDQSIRNWRDFLQEFLDNL